MAQNFAFTLWDVGHGLSTWLQMPSGHSHWIDLGSTQDFSPSQHVKDNYGVASVDYLIISHPDQDHLSDLPNFLEAFGTSFTLRRNRTLPTEDRYGGETLQYQRDFKRVDQSHTSDVAWENNPRNPARNGGVEYAVAQLDYGDTPSGVRIEGNNTDLSSRLAVVPVLNQAGRWRIGFDASLSREIVSDFYLSVGLHEQYDSKPPTEDTEKNDFSVTTSFGWSF